jgi:hypothetical protein
MISEKYELTGDLADTIKQSSFVEDALTLHNIRTLRNSEAAESLIDQMSQRQSIINQGDVFNVRN